MGGSLFVEAVRLLITLAVLVAGFNVGRWWPTWFSNAGLDPGTTVVWGAVLGAGFGYVIGGVVGRALRRSIDVAPQAVSRASGPELFAGAFGLITGIIVASVLAVPMVVLLPLKVGWPLAGVLVLVLSAFGSRIFASRADDLLSVAGLRRAPSKTTGGGSSQDRYLIDSSAAIDGRILDLARSGLVKNDVWVPGFVIDELQAIADSAEKTRRRRGRRGLDVLDAFGNVAGLSFLVLEDTVPEHQEVDGKLLALASRLDAALVTTDHNLARAASVRGLRVVNPHSLGEMMRPVVSSGDRIEVTIEREGSEPGQGVAFLDDGTMVVVSDGAEMVGRVAAVEVSNMLRTAVGRMVFATRVP